MPVEVLCLQIQRKYVCKQAYQLTRDLFYCLSPQISPWLTTTLSRHDLGCCIHFIFLSMPTLSASAAPSFLWLAIHRTEPSSTDRPLTQFCSQARIARRSRAGSCR